METTTSAPAAPFALLDVEDLHDTDFEVVLGDVLPDAGMAVASAGALAGLVGHGAARNAVRAHTLSASALFLAIG